MQRATARTEHEPSQDGGRRGIAWGAVLTWALLGVGLAAAFLAAVYWKPDADGGQLPVLRSVASFELVDEQGTPFSSSQLVGRVWVADFFFTRCSQACPLMASRMRVVQEWLLATPERRRGAGIVSFTLDPQNDRPEILRAYARRNGADASVWTFLTESRGARSPESSDGGSSPTRIDSLCVDGFGLSAGNSAQGTLHSDRFALVDARGRIRAYYRPTVVEGDLERLLEDLDRLLREAPSVTRR